MSFPAVLLAAEEMSVTAVLPSFTMLPAAKVPTTVPSTLSSAVLRTTKDAQLC